MRKLILLITVLFSGCSYGVYFHNEPQRIIADVDNPQMYEFIDTTEIGDSVGLYNAKKGDTLQSESFIYSIDLAGSHYYYITDSGNKKITLRTPEVLTEKEHYGKYGVNYFFIPIEKDKEVWSEVIQYVIDNSTMKLQLQTDYVIDTYNPGAYGIGFRVVKIYLEKSIKIEINKFCGYNCSHESNIVAKYFKDKYQK
jgi:hypothetical protein